MSQEYIVPVDHSSASAVATTAASAGKHGLTGMLKGAVTGIIGSGVFFGLIGLAIGMAVGAPVLALAIGAGAGVIFSGPLLGFGATLGAALGLIGGTAKGMSKVSHEQGAAQMMQAQLAAEQAQAMGQTNIYAQDVSMPQQGSRMNPAASQVNLDGLQRDGVLADNLALQRA